MICAVLKDGSWIVDQRIYMDRLFGAAMRKDWQNFFFSHSAIFKSDSVRCVYFLFLWSGLFCCVRTLYASISIAFTLIICDCLTLFTLYHSLWPHKRLYLSRMKNQHGHWLGVMMMSLGTQCLPSKTTLEKGIWPWNPISKSNDTAVVRQ